MSLNHLELKTKSEKKSEGPPKKEALRSQSVLMNTVS